MPILKKSYQNSGIDSALICLNQIAAVSSSLAHANELEQKHAQQDLYGVILGKFHSHWSSSFGERLSKA